MGNYHYKAFISYSHKDQRWGGWLHRRLERYRLPKHLIKNEESVRLKPIFRDREELSAADNLGEKIEQAITASENLIVICSPHAAKSHWVNQEILSFKRQNRGAKIFSIIVDGEPFSGGTDECMPPALRFQMGADGELTDEPAEPLAADLRNTGDGKRLGVLKIISGMLGVRLDELVQRDLQRNRSRVTAITATALATVLAMGTLTGFALSARKDAEVKRVEAEGLVEYMLTDLQSELQPVGRIDMLDGLTERVFQYYEDQSIETLNCASSGRYARAMHLKTEILFDKGDLSNAKQYTDKAFAITKKRLSSCPQRGKVLIDHGVSYFYMSYNNSYAGDMVAYEENTLKYDALVKEFCAQFPQTDDCHLNTAYVQVGMGVTETRRKDGDYNLAEQHFRKAIDSYEQSQAFENGKLLTHIYHADAHGWLATNYQNAGQNSLAIITRQKEYSLYEAIKNKRKSNFQNSETLLEKKKLGAQLGQGRALIAKKSGQDAKNLFQAMLPHADTLSARDPKNEDWRSMRLWALIGLGAAENILGNTEEACQRYQQAIAYKISAPLPKKEFDLAIRRFNNPNFSTCQ